MNYESILGGMTEIIDKDPRKEEEWLRQSFLNVDVELRK
jgi:hypothetical protein